MLTYHHNQSHIRNVHDDHDDDHVDGVQDGNVHDLSGDVHDKELHHRLDDGNWYLRMFTISKMIKMFVRMMRIGVIWKIPR